MSVLSAPHFHDEEAAYAFVEERLWPNGPVCPRCGENERVGKLQGKSTRIGVHKCYVCRKPFTVKIGTIFEASHIPMNVWLQAIHLMCASKKGFSANQFSRTLGITLKSAWFLAHRIREAMRDETLPPLGGKGNSVQADETYHGKLETPRPRNPYLPPPTKAGKRGGYQKRAILALVSEGRTRVFHVADTKAATVRKILLANVHRESELHTDESPIYKRVGPEFAAHRTVKHSAGEYVRDGATINNVENFFSVFKRGMKGVYQHCRERHLSRYLSEYQFRYNLRSGLGFSDTERAEAALLGVVGKRLTYREPAEKKETPPR